MKTFIWIMVLLAFLVVGFYGLYRLERWSQRREIDNTITEINKLVSDNNRFVIVDKCKIGVYDGYGDITQGFILEDRETKEQYLYFWGGSRLNGGPTMTHIVKPQPKEAENGSK